MTDVISTGEVDTELTVFPIPRKCPFKLPEEYVGMRADNPVAKATFRVSGKQIWVVSRQEHVRQVLSDQTLSSNWRNPGYPLPFPVPQEILDQMDLPLIALDPPEHTVRRRMLIPGFTAKRVQAMRPKVQEIVDERVTAILAMDGAADLVRELAVPVPALVFCELLGIPSDEGDYLLRHAAMTSNRNVDSQELNASHQQMVSYLDKLVSDKGANPGDDLVSLMVARNAADGQLTHADLVSLVEVLLVGGLDTVASAIALGTALLLDNPDQLDQIKRDPELIRNAVSEILRYLSISDSVTSRVLPHDLEIDGVVIPAGDGIIALNGSANHDERAWTNPEEFDIHREDAKNHSAFGHGIHACPGSGLARVELETVFTTLFTRIPGLRLAVPVADLPFKLETLSYGLYELPVAW